MVRMAEELQDEGDLEAVSVELPAPAGWKKFISKKVGTPKRNEIAFISPTGEEIRYKSHLDKYLRSHPGGPSSSEFDWGYGDTPRRSSRLSEKAKEMETPEEEPSKKQGTHSSSKKGSKKKKEDRDSDAEDYSPEAKRPKKRERKHSTPKKGTKPKTNSVDAGIGNEELEKYTLDTEAPESSEDAIMKDAQNVSVAENEASSIKVISEDTCAKVDSKDECKHENDAVAEVEYKAPGSVKIATEELESVEDLNVNDSEVGSIKEIETAKLDSDDGTKLKKNDDDADIEDKAPESEKIVTQALERIEDSDTKDVAKVYSNDDFNAEMEEAPISENTATQALKSTGDLDIKNVAELGSNNDLDAEMNDVVPETEQIDAEAKNVAKVVSNDDIDAEAKNAVTEVITTAEALDTKLDAEVKNEDPESEKVAAEALKEALEEDIHERECGEEEKEDKVLLNENHKGELVSPSKAIPNANCRDLKSPEKAAAIV